MKTWLVALVLSGLSLWVQGAEIAGRVVGVSDGDTITVLDSQRVQHKVRLQGIDAPEKKQSFGQRAKEHLSNQVFNRFVAVQFDKRDRYPPARAAIWLTAFWMHSPVARMP
jgi:endonuclease YncB( thermonuclease family)